MSIKSLMNAKMNEKCADIVTLSAGLGLTKYNYLSSHFPASPFFL